MVSSSSTTTLNINQHRFAPEPWCGKHLNETEPPLKNVYHYATRKDASDKTPMCMVAELARYHKLKHEYILLDEDGPAHKKRFTVKLVLREGEIFEGSGPSIKKAQQNAAKVALERTSLGRPPAKNQKAKKDPNSPTALLAHVADKLQIGVNYKDICPPKPQPQQLYNYPYPPTCEPSSPMMPPMALMNVPIPPHGQAFNNRFFRPFMQAPPGTPPSRMYFPPLRMPVPVSTVPPMTQNNGFVPTTTPNGPAPLHVFHPAPVSLPTDDEPVYTSHCYLSTGTTFTAEGKSRFESRCAAATKALTYLQPRLAELDAKVRTEVTNGTVTSSNSSESSQTSAEEETNGNKENSVSAVFADLSLNESTESQTPGTPSNRKDSNVKSVVSQVHEYALRLKMNVEFEVLKEAGEPHKREYLLRCTLYAEGKDSIKAEGTGSSKKNAKQDACAKMLEKLRGIENDPLYLASMIVMTAKKNSTASSAKEPKRKTIIKDMKKDPLYGHHINPVSRLIQVTQSQKGLEPEFVLISETGQNRYKVFTVEVRYNGISLPGSGPNKRLAKRAAAERMLDHLGFVKPMPQPGKSLLKKRASTSVDEPSVVKIDVFDPNELMAKPEPVFVANPDPTPTPHVRMDMETFADVDSAFGEPEKQPERPAVIGASKSVDDVAVERKPSTPDSGGEGGDAAPMQKRRVTFSNSVSACPPPEDVNYPLASHEPLRSEVVIVSKPKKRGKDSKKTLTPEETAIVASQCRYFLSYQKSAEELRGYIYPDSPADPSASSDWQLRSPPFVTAKERLESLALRFKFTVTYCDLPSMTDASGNGFCSLVTIGITPPIVQQGPGPSQEDAHQQAAYNAIGKLAQIDAVLNAIAGNDLPLAM